MENEHRSEYILEVENLVKYFSIRRGILSKTVGYVKAVDGISFKLRSGEIMGLVGESGCGKTTAGRTILRLIEPTSGVIRYNGRDITKIPQNELRGLRRNMQIIFQDPFESLNPRMTVYGIIGESLGVHGIVKRAEGKKRVQSLMEKVGLDPRYVNRYPHEFSGGQRQRIGIARALALNPSLIICDEPVSALDVSIQAQIINLLKDLQTEFKFSYLVIAHDLSVVEYISNRVAVMYLGKIVEIAPGRELYANPMHPYTKALLSAIPVTHPKLRKKERTLLEGDVPSPINPPSGCHFHTRCPIMEERCKQIDPPGINAGQDHTVYCIKVTPCNV